MAIQCSLLRLLMGWAYSMPSIVAKGSERAQNARQERKAGEAFLCPLKGWEYPLIILVRDDMEVYKKRAEMVLCAFLGEWYKVCFTARESQRRSSGL